MLSTSNREHHVSAIIWHKGSYKVEIDGKIHRAGRRRTLRRMAQRMTGLTPGVVRGHTVYAR